MPCQGPIFATESNRQLAKFIDPSTLHLNHTKPRRRLHKGSLGQLNHLPYLSRVGNFGHHTYHRHSQVLPRNHRSSLVNVRTIIMSSRERIRQCTGTDTHRLRRRQGHSAIFLTYSNNQRTVRQGRFNNHPTSTIVTIHSSSNNRISAKLFTSLCRQFMSLLRTRIRHRNAVVTSTLHHVNDVSGGSQHSSVLGV